MKKEKRLAGRTNAAAIPPVDFDDVLQLIVAARSRVNALAGYIQRRQPNARGFSARNLWRMMQFYEMYSDLRKLAPLLRELSWSHNLAIMSRSKHEEEREFYLRQAVREKWSFRQLQRQLNGALFERTILLPVKLSTPLTELHPAAASIFKDSYLVEFLDLSDNHSEVQAARPALEAPTAKKSSKNEALTRKFKSVR